jgi:menaquinone-dependent protoporphyrinogen oxidase
VDDSTELSITLVFIPEFHPVRYTGREDAVRPNRSRWGRRPQHVQYRDDIDHVVAQHEPRADAPPGIPAMNGCRETGAVVALSAGKPQWAVPGITERREAASFALRGGAHLWHTECDRHGGKHPMKAAIFFATREGQTRKIAERLAADLRTHGIETDVMDVRSLRSPVDWSCYGVACVAGSVHAGHHERELIAFVRRHREALSARSAIFLSVTLSAAGAEDQTAPAVRREQSAADAQRMIELFVAETGWRPAWSSPLAGALAYTHYNFVVKFVMKRIARKQGASTDTSRDHEFTNWAAVDAIAERLVTAMATTAS